MLAGPTFAFPAVQFFNRVLSDYPAARHRLRAHDGKVVAAQVGPAAMRMRVTADGEMELVGNAGTPTPDADVSLTVPLSLLPRLVNKDESALAQIVFTGDAELAATLSDIARNVEWDVEADLSRVVGDVAAHRMVGTAQRAHAWQIDARQRFTANVAEYLTEERQAFIVTRELENLARQNETLRDDIARLDARLAKIPLRG